MRARVQSASMSKSEADRFPILMGMIKNEVDYEVYISKESIHLVFFFLGELSKPPVVLRYFSIFGEYFVIPWFVLW